jgi:ABC-2 type transport system ATP-binding protein
MDEAERCHEIAFIFRGQLLDTGTPRQIVERRGLRAAEAEMADAERVVPLLRADPRVDEVAHYGHLIRVCTKHHEDPLRVVHDMARELGSKPTEVREVRATVEDAFVSMVREEDRAREAGQSGLLAGAA